MAAEAAVENQLEAPKPSGSDAPPDDGDKGGDQPVKPDDKKPVQKRDNRSTSGSCDGPVCHDKGTLAKGQKSKYPLNYISVQVTQRTGRVVLLNSFGLLKADQKKADIFFHMDVTLNDNTVVQGGEWPEVSWYPDTPLMGAPTQYLSWFIEVHHSLFPRV